MKNKMEELKSLVDVVDMFCHENEIDFVFAAQAKDKTFSLKMVSQGAKSILNLVDDIKNKIIS